MVVLAFVLIIIALMVGIIILTHFTIAKPLSKLTQVTQNIALGKLDTKVDPSLLSSKDEIGQLSREFRDMTTKLREANLDLEKKVKERTTELQSRTEELEQTNKFMVGRELKMAEMKKMLKKEVNQHE